MHIFELRQRIARKHFSAHLAIVRFVYSRNIHHVWIASQIFFLLINVYRYARRVPFNIINRSVSAIWLSNSKIKSRKPIELRYLELKGIRKRLWANIFWGHFLRACILQAIWSIQSSNHITINFIWDHSEILSNSIKLLLFSAH